MSPTYIVIIIYFVLILWLARFFSRRESIQDYFINSRSSSLWLLVFSNVATLVWAGAVVTTVSEVYSTWISFWITNLASMVFGAILMAIFAPKMFEFWKKYWIYNVVDFFAKRFDKKNQIIALILQLLLLLIWTTLQIVAIGFLINALSWISYMLSLLIAMLFTIVYTSLWWLKIDIITDFIQFWIILIVLILMAIFGYNEIGSFSNLMAQLPSANLNVFSFWWVGFFVWTILFGALIYLPNSAHRQRILSAKNVSVAKNSYYLSFPFILLMMLIIIFLWLLATIFLWEVPKDTAVFELMKHMFSNKWLLWLGFACVLAVIMSSIDSLLVAWSAIIYTWLFKDRESNNKKRIWFARLLTSWFGLICLVLAILVPDMVTLALFVAYLALIFVPAIIAGLYWSKTSANASFYSILIPTIVLALGYIPVWKNIFVITTLLAILIILFYDKIFRKWK